LLTVTLLVGLAGMATELLLIGHVESPQQWIPLVLLATGFAVAGWDAVSSSQASVRALRVVMTLCVVTGAIGVVLHYQGNEAFELEMYAGMAGIELVRKTLTGATPVLAPGSMTLLGLIGLTQTYAHAPTQRTADAVHGQRGET
jgi:hypothetical protein